jgi:hypothetical protein
VTTSERHVGEVEQVAASTIQCCRHYRTTVKQDQGFRLPRPMNDAKLEPPRCPPSAPPWCSTVIFRRFGKTPDFEGLLRYRKKVAERVGVKLMIF